jgi:hypothetical protein
VQSSAAKFASIKSNLFRMRRIFLKLLALIVTLIIGVSADVAWSAYNPPFVKERDTVRYVMLADNMITIIAIGVDSNVSERQLYATLSQAADEHMNEPARDYLFVPYLNVEAYLIKDGKQSSKIAGSLRRFVPPRNPTIESSILDAITLGKSDSFTSNLSRAVRSF